MTYLDKTDVGLRVKKLREATGLTKADMAAKCGLAKSFFSGVESGRYGMTNYSMIKVCTALGVTPNDVLCEKL